MARIKKLKIGARVRHNNNSSLDEGVVVFISTGETNINVKNGTPYSVHWSNQTKGNYSEEEISRINPKATLEQIKKEVEQYV